MARVSKMSFVSVGTSSQTLLSNSPTRRAVSIFGSTAGRVTISTDSPAVLDNGPTFVQSQSPIVLTEETHGGVVHASIFAIAAVANSIVGIIETLEG